MRTLYPDQKRVVGDLRTAFRAGYKRPLMVLPTGGGKGEIFSTIIRDASGKGQRIGLLAPRSELVRDLSRRLDRYGVNHGVYHGQQSRSTHLGVQVASIPTLVSRAKRGSCPKFDLLILDEAHLSASDGCRDVIDATHARFIIGGTATPCRLDGRALGDTFDVMIKGPSTAALMDLGRLVRYRHLSASMPDVAAMSDSQVDEQDVAMQRSHVYGDVIDTWGKHGRERPSIGFFVNKRASIEVQDRFLAAGVRAVHVDAMTPFADRDRIWRALSDGSIQYVCSVGIISLGWDVPPVSYESMCFHTDSLARYLQALGRILRVSPGKGEAILADHAGNWMRHGLGDDDREWTLDGRSGRGEDLPPEIRPRVCPDCEMLCKQTAESCICGYVFIRARQASGPIELPQVELRDVRAGDDAMAKLESVSNYKQAALLKRLLREARQKYAQETGKEAKPHWSCQIIKAILVRNSLD